MPVTKTIFLKDDSLCEPRCSIPIKSDLDRFLFINGATFNQLSVVNDCLGLKLELSNRGLVVRVDDDDIVGIALAFSLALHKPLYYAVFEAFDRLWGNVGTYRLRPRG